MNKKFLLVLVGLFLISFTSAAALSEPTVCCEETKPDSVGNGVASCINTEIENCNPLENMAPANCDQTSFCRL